jgi:hypothetical protein
MSFWYGVLGVLGASALIFAALSVNGKTEPPAGHDNHGHGHDGHGHGHGHH